MPKQIDGDFTATGQSSEISMVKGSVIVMKFDGTATVNVELKTPDAQWVVVETVTADYAKTWDAPDGVVRLNCTAYTDDVEYVVGMRPE